MPRLFIGWSFPGDLREEIGRIAESLRRDLPPASWTRSSTYHITFAFLGDQEEETIDRLEGVLIESLGSVTPAATALGEAGFFPSDRRPRVGWLGLRDEDAVASISRAVRSALRDATIPFDDKPFHPHLTLVRPRVRWRRGDAERFVSAWDSLRGRPLLVDSGTLFESRLGSGGARHIPRIVARCKRD